MPDLTFPMPQGFIPPEATDSDGSFQAMATFKLVDENTLQLIDVEGYAVSDEDTSGDTQAARQADQANIASALQGAGSAAGAESNMSPAQGAAPAGAPGQAAGGGAQAPPGTQAAMPTPTFGERMRQRFKTATGRP